ncbi:MAG TPA: hypothetical protein ENI20_07205 [Bacteroides sp.]|nr:hypothetical protein [Bacteroides sp.]
MTEFENFIESEKARSVVFNIFSALFCQPEKAVIRDQKVFNNLEKSILISYPDNHGPTSKLFPAAGKFTDTELLVEYSRLFIGPFKTLAPPYSSVYLGSENLVYSEETIWVVQFYRKAGLDFNRDIHDLPDHIAIEMEFIYYLIYHEVSQLQENNIEKARFFHEHQLEFIQEHFVKWAPVFCDTILRETNNEYYRSLAESLRSFIEVDFLQEFPKESS